MPELTFDRGAFDDALEFARATGAATRIGEAIAQGALDFLATNLPPPAPPSRDQLAAMAMQGLAADPSTAGRQPVSIAVEAYRLADAMLAERARPPAPLSPAPDSTPPAPNPAAADLF